MAAIVNKTLDELLKDSPSSTVSILDILDNNIRTNKSKGSIKFMLNRAFSHDGFVRHLSIRDLTPAYVGRLDNLLNQYPVARQALAANAAASFELLNHLGDDPDFRVRLNLKAQMENRPELAGLKFSTRNLETDQQALERIKNLFEEVAPQVGLTLGEIKWGEDKEGIYLSDGVLLVYLTESQPKQDFRGVLFEDRAYGLSEAVFVPGTRHEPDSADEREVGIYSNHHELVRETLAHMVRFSAYNILNLKGEMEWCAEFEKSEAARLAEEEESSLSMA